LDRRFDLPLLRLIPRVKAASLPVRLYLYAGPFIMASVLCFLLLLVGSGNLPAEVEAGWKKWQERQAEKPLAWRVVEYQEDKLAQKNESQYSAYFSRDAFVLHLLAGGKRPLDAVIAVNPRYAFRVQQNAAGEWVLDKYGPPSESMRAMAMQELLITAAPYFIPTMTDNRLDKLLAQEWEVRELRESGGLLEIEFTTRARLEQPINGATQRSFSGTMGLRKSRDYAIETLEGSVTVGDGKQSLEIPWSHATRYRENAGRATVETLSLARGRAPTRYVQEVTFEADPPSGSCAEMCELEHYGLHAPTTIARVRSRSYFWPTAGIAGMALLASLLVRSRFTGRGV
jgi:hypothetical protein